MTRDPDEMADGLAPDAAAFLDSIRELDQPSPGDRRRVRGRVLAAVAATGAASAAGGTATAAAATSAGGTAGAGLIGSTLAAKVWIGVAVGLVGAGVAGGVATLAPSNEPIAASEPESESEPQSASEPTSQSEEPESEPEPTDTSQAVPVAAPNEPLVRPAPAPGTTTAPPPVDPAADLDTLSAELALIRRAHGAANDDNHQEALRILAEHAHRFPTGSLSSEREGARAISLCSVGRAAEGALVAERFLRAHPGSPLRARVSRACAE